MIRTRVTFQCCCLFVYIFAGENNFYSQYPKHFHLLEEKVVTNSTCKTLFYFLHFQMFLSFIEEEKSWTKHLRNSTKKEERQKLNKWESVALNSAIN